MSPLRVLLRYLEKVLLDLAPGLALLRTRAEFFKSLLDLGSIFYAAEKTTNFEVIAQTLQAMSKALADRGHQGDLKPASSTTATLHEDSQADLGGVSAPAKKRKRFNTADINTKLDFQASPLCFIASLLVTGLKKKRLRDLDTGADLNGLVSELRMLVEWFDKLPNHCKSDDEYSDMSEILAVLPLSFECSHISGRSRPSAIQARSALKAILGSLELSGNVGESAKTMMSYPIPETAVGHARAHSAAALTDDATRTHFKTALQYSEQCFDSAFEDLEAWVEKGSPDGNPLDMQGLQSAMGEISATLAQSPNFVHRWPTSALQDFAPELVDTSTNMTELVLAGVWRMITEASLKLCTAGLGTKDFNLARPVGDDALIPEGALLGGDAQPPLQGHEAKGGGNGNSLDMTTRASAHDSRTKTSNEVSATVTKIGDFLKHLCKSMGLLKSDVEDRIGTEVFSNMDPSPALIHGDIALNIAEINNIFDDIKHVSAHSVHHKRDFGKARIGNSDHCTCVDSLLRFANLHTKFKDAGMILASKSSIDEGQASAEFSTRFTTMLNDIGAPLYQQHAGAFISERTAEIVKARIEISVVDEVVMRDEVVADPLSLILTPPPPPCESLMPNASLATPSDPTQLSMVSHSIPHNIAMNNLDDFINAVGLQTLNTEILKKPGSIGMAIPVHTVRVASKATCIVRDLATLAPIPSRALLKDEEATNAIPINDILGYHTHVFAL